MNRQNVALSGVAMLLIVLNHTIYLGTEYATKLGVFSNTGLGYYILWIFQALGSFAVPIFLFISGSFVAYAARGEPPRLTRKFLQSGLIHILVPYLIWTIIFYLVLNLNRGEAYALTEYIQRLLVGNPFHFIPLLVFFYLISPILVPLGKRFPWVLILVFLAYQIFLLNIKYPGTLGFSFPGWMNRLELPILGGTLADWGVCFPLGIVFSLNMPKIRPALEKLKWLFTGLAFLSFVIGLLDARQLISAPFVRFIGPIVFLLVIPVIPRNSIPAVRRLEEVGKRSYGIYLTHLIVLDTVYTLIFSLVPASLKYTSILIPFVFVIGLLVPLGVMNYFSKSPLRKYYRYIFG